MGLHAESRHRYILERLRLKGRIEVPEIAAQLNVTQVTVRRDLAAMNKKGLLKKTYGGAVLAEPNLNTSVKYRQTKNLTAKKIIGRLAADLIEDGNIIYLEAGSTCYEIIPYLEQKTDLTIIVNSLYLMGRLHGMSKHKIILIGGQYRPETMDMVGPASEEAISQLGGFKAFTGADDISIKTGISGADITTVRFAKLVVQRASEVIFVGDKSKFNKPALYKFADLDIIDSIVTDRNPGEEWQKTATQNNIELIYAE